LTEYLCKRGIGTEVYYPIPLHLQPCFRYLGHREGDFPNAERACKRALALPLYSELSEDEVHVVCDAVEAFYSSKEE
jgi:dTDP-4-amino-4,6-dideoxygalactose transaminase